MSTDKRQRILLLTMLAAASAAMMAHGRVAAQPADDGRSGESARSAPGGLAGDRAPTGSNVLARADLLPTEGNTGHGTVTFERAPNRDAVIVNVSLFGLEPGEHGFHVHENGDCGGTKAEAAGGHWNPQNTQHGGLDKPAAQRHAGDLGNVTASDRGELDVSVDSDALLENGRLGVVGRAIVVHTGPDDLRSQPSGQSGDPVACGVIRAVAATPGA